VVDYKFIDGKLFKWIFYAYEYPDEITKYGEHESTVVVKGKTEPNGDGLLTINDKAQPTVEKITFRDIPVDDLWMPLPKFGDWEDLANPSFGNLPLPGRAQ
jgi:hypothetical protein